MNIPNLANQKPILPLTTSPLFSLPLVVVLVIGSICSGFVLSRLFAFNQSSSSILTLNNQSAVSTDNITNKDSLVVGKLYGNTNSVFKDTATGTLEKGSINGEGTHILNRPGGAAQRASLTSSTVDLDLFVDKKVEVKGETNASTKTSWLLDVGTIKILE